MEQEKQDKTFMLACHLRLIYSLLFNLFFSFKSKIHTDIYVFCLFACLSIPTPFTKWHFYLIAATKSCSVTTTIAKVNLIFHQERKTISKWKKCQYCRWFTSILMNQHTKSQPKLLNRRRKAYTYTYIYGLFISKWHVHPITSSIDYASLICLQKSVYLCCLFH